MPSFFILVYRVEGGKPNNIAAPKDDVRVVARGVSLYAHYLIR